MSDDLKKRVQSAYYKARDDHIYAWDATEMFRDFNEEEDRIKRFKPAIKSVTPASKTKHKSKSKGKTSVSGPGFEIKDSEFMKDLLEKASRGKFDEEFVNKEEEIEGFTLEFGNVEIDFPDKRNVIYNGYVIDPDHLDAINIIGKAITSGQSINVLALGDAGSGKTTFATILADLLQMDYYLHRCQLMRDVTEWWGKTGLEDGNTRFFQSQLSKKMSQGKTVVLWDEFSRVIPSTANGLISVMDDTRSVEFQDNDLAIEIPVGEQTLIYGTANIGNEFFGTYGIDRAIFDRWQIFLNFQPMSEKREVELVQLNSGLEKEEAESLVTVMRDLRSTVENENNDLDLPFALSIRKTLNVANLINNGATLKGALKLAIINGCDPDTKVTLTDIINGQSSRYK